MRKILRAIRGRLAAFENIPPIPAGISITTIGKSVSGKPILAYRIGTGQQHIVLIGAIHGNEVGTTKFAIKFLAHAASRMAGTDITLHVIPTLNIDGYGHALQKPSYMHGGKVGRFNNRSVDLNRNFNTKSFSSRSWWSHGKDYRKQTEVFCGAQGNSEPETAAIATYLEKYSPKLVISLHSVGKDILAGAIDPSQAIAEELSEKTGFRVMSHAEWVKLNHTGTFKEWCDEHAIPFIEIELMSRWGSDWNRMGPALFETITAAFRK